MASDIWLGSHDEKARKIEDLSHAFVTSQFGECVAVASGSRLLSLEFIGDRNGALAALHARWPGSLIRHEPGVESIVDLAFREPDRVPIIAIGTSFQIKVWQFLRCSLKELTMTYGDVAQAIGRPKAARAVGQAVGANKLALLIPCHRVVSRGKLIGYRWGIERKRALLTWELGRRDPLRMPF